MAKPNVIKTDQQHDLPPGLKITDRGLFDRVIELTGEYQRAVDRHVSVISFLDKYVDAPAGGKLILLFVVNDAILDIERLRAAVSAGSSCYKEKNIFYLEFACEGGWLDRRSVSPQTAIAIHKNNGCKVSQSDWRWASAALKELHPTRPTRFAWSGFIADARSWWYGHLQGPLIDHSFGLSTLQLLPKAALVRRATGDPQSPTLHPNDSTDTENVELVQMTYAHSLDTRIFEALKIFVGQIAREKRSKAAAREYILAHIQQQMPVAAAAGRTQVAVLAALKHAIGAGGIRGDLWAPLTIYEYLRLGIVDLVRILIGKDLDSLNGDDFHEIYLVLIEKLPESQRGKFGAFLQAFHRFLLICGFDHLPRSLSGKRDPLPPASSVVWEHELRLAIEYVEGVSPTVRIALQAKLALFLGYHIPLRTGEVWCIRIGDVQVNNPMLLSIYPRQRDGIGKVKSLRRQEDINNEELKDQLIQMVRLRQLEDDADDEDLLFGQPGQPNKRHAQLITAKLINDALKWATGDASASFYDLRHTVFSSRARAVLEEELPPNDAMGWYQLAAQSGHAGPASSASYIHQIEHALALVSQSARPEAWTGAGHIDASTEVFADLSCARNVVREPLLDRMLVDAPLRSSVEVGIKSRTGIAWRVAQKVKFESIASELEMPLELVAKVAEELTQALLLRKLVRAEMTLTPRKQCQCISAHLPWARASRQNKYQTVAKHLERCFEQSDSKALMQIWQDWSQCQEGDFLALDNPRPATRLVSLYLKIGIDRKSMAVASMEGARPLTPSIQEFRLASRPCKERSQRSAHRLVLTPSGVDAVKASGATISVVGLHWLMLVVGSLLIAREDI